MNRLKTNVLLQTLMFWFPCCLLLCCVTTVVDAKIVFCVDGDIFVMDDDGSRRRRLTHSTQATHSDPCWSPDGTQIAFTKYMDRTKTQSSSEVFIMNADGTDPQRLTHNNVMDLDPCWSPDGTQIAFSSTRSGDWGVFIIDVATLAVTQLTDAPSASPDWSPDGTQIVFERFITILNGINPKTIYVMDADGQHQRRVLPDPPLDGPLTLRYFPCWSADGERILFYEDKWFKEGDVLRLIVQQVGGRKKKKEIRDINDRLGNNLNLAGTSWMENDRSMLVSIKINDKPNASYDIYRYGFETRGLRRLTREASDEEWPDWTEGALSVSPHGKLLTQWGKIKDPTK